MLCFPELLAVVIFGRVGVLTGSLGDVFLVGEFGLVVFWSLYLTVAL